MINKFKMMILSQAASVCALVAFIAPLISQDCQGLWYQSVEPEGLDEFTEYAMENSFK